MLRGAFTKVAVLAAALALCAGMPAAMGAELVTLPVPTVTIYPGDLIDAGRLTDRTFVESQFRRGYVDSKAVLVGKVAKRTLLPDRPVAENAIGEVDLVTRGTAVQLVFQQPGLTITTYASPLQDGSAGDLIRVRNTDSGAVVVGIVQPDGTVRVGGE
jgi:flagella basal body P-ring formation protein FlgA